MSTLRFFAILLILTAVTSACASAPTATPTPALTPVTLQLKFVHGAQFAGFYAAAENGYYRNEGLDVALLPGAVEIDVLKTVLDGKAQFGVIGAVDLIPARADGRPVSAISTVYRRNPNIFISLTSAGVTRPQDFVGKKIRSVSDMPLILHSMMGRLGIRPDQYTEVNLPTDLALFATGEVPVWGAYTNVLLVAARQAGLQVNVIYPDDYGVHFYADTIFTTDDMIAKNPDLVVCFLRATLKGWTYAVENPAAIGPMVVKYMPTGDPALEAVKMTASIPLVNTGEDHIGWMKPEIWAGMEKTLREQDVLTKFVDVTQVYTMQFLKEIYK
ncbi:MAG: ABC transporter substrate-binding protein [Chloroflexi bacterium]|nr:ABC transporter substrate-binding protein [Chloroflexota bacterium]